MRCNHDNRDLAPLASGGFLYAAGSRLATHTHEAGTRADRIVQTCERGTPGRGETTAATASPPGPAGTLAVVATGTLLVLVAFTVPLGTLSTTASDLHAGAGAQAWILSAMSLAVRPA